jgi:hypothetical protein
MVPAQTRQLTANVTATEYGILIIVYEPLRRLLSVFFSLFRHPLYLNGFAAINRQPVAAQGP